VRAAEGGSLARSDRLSPERRVGSLSFSTHASQCSLERPACPLSFFRRTPAFPLSLSSLLIADLPPQTYECYLNGRDYIVREGEVVIVDQSTGRIRTNTRWSAGIHQVPRVRGRGGLGLLCAGMDLTP
jgi:hypothetical protein